LPFLACEPDQVCVAFRPAPGPSIRTHPRRLRHTHAPEHTWYDDEGNRLTKTVIVSGEVEEYEWDHRNRLTAITERTSATGAVTKTTDYEYDVFNHRLSKSIDADGTGTGTAVNTHVIRDGENIVLQYGHANNVTNRYVHGPSVDQILADEQASGNRLWPLTDKQGTVRDVADYDSGITSIANHLAYDSYGKITSETNAAIDHVFAYTGSERDDESDLYYHGMRYVDPAVVHYLSEDPMSFAAGDSNLSRYVANSPLNFTDGAGLVPFARQVGQFFSDYWYYLWNPSAMDADIQIVQTAAVGVAVGAATAAVVVVAAPAIATAGAIGLVHAGVAPTTATVYSSAFVTVGLGGIGAVGSINLFVDTVLAADEGNWNKVAFNVGMAIGGGYVAKRGGAIKLTNSLNKFVGQPPSAAPKIWNWNAFRQHEQLLSYDKTKGTGIEWLSTAPDVYYNGFMLTVSPCVYRSPEIMHRLRCWFGNL
jgi:RHS repeat-associated protein